MAHGMQGRFTAKMDEPFVVFLIGMRINCPLSIGKWLPTARAMGPMLRELYRHPEKGFLGGEFFFYGRGPVVLQYWRSFEDLERFARDPEDPHMPAWQRFNREARKGGAVGIWHETYLVDYGTVVPVSRAALDPFQPPPDHLRAAVDGLGDGVRGVERRDHAVHEQLAPALCRASRGPGFRRTPARERLPPDVGGTQAYGSFRRTRLKSAPPLSSSATAASRLNGRPPESGRGLELAEVMARSTQETPRGTASGSVCSACTFM